MREKLSIAIVTPRFPIIGEAFIMDQIVSLKSRGHSVRIFAGFDPQEKNVHEDVVKYALQPLTTYYQPPTNKWARLGPAFRILGCNLMRRRYELLRALNVFSYGKHALSLNFLFNSSPFAGTKFDVVHCHYGPTGKQFLFLKQWYQVPLLVSFHGYDYTKLPRESGTDMYDELFESADLCTGPSNYAVDRLISLGCPKTKAIELRYGIHTSKYSFSHRSLRVGRPVEILSVGRLVNKKGYAFSLQAVAIASREYDVRYTVIGAGDEKAQQEFMKLVELNGLLGKVRLLQSMPRSELTAIYEASDLFLLGSCTASSGDQESCGVVLLEAQACGLPVVATRHNGFPETVVDGESAILAREADAEDLGAALLKVLSKGDSWGEMGIGGRAHVEKNFDSRVVADCLENIYRSIL